MSLLKTQIQLSQTMDITDNVTNASHQIKKDFYPYQPLQQQKLMLVVPQDALLMKVRGLFLTQTAFSATRLAKKVKRAACWTTKPISNSLNDQTC